MSYKTILLHTDMARSAPVRTQLAATLARHQQAHLVCAAMTGVSRYVQKPGGRPPHTGFPADLMEIAARRAREALDDAAAMVGKLDVPSHEQRLVEDDAYGGLTLQARYADLVVVSQADRDDPATGSLLQDLPEHVVLNCCRPVLTVPCAGHFTSIGARILAAWDGSHSATRAITNALPLLRQASSVTVAVIDATIGADEHGEEPGADMARYLARHGVAVDVVREASDGDVGEALLAMADRRRADLLVMGAFGHTRFREMLLGGATRTVLGAMTVPVLLSH